MDMDIQGICLREEERGVEVNTEKSLPVLSAVVTCEQSKGLVITHRMTG
jgi:hypothetical protein